LFVDLPIGRIKERLTHRIEFPLRAIKEHISQDMMEAQSITTKVHFTCAFGKRESHWPPDKEPVWVVYEEAIGIGRPSAPESLPNAGVQREAGATVKVKPGGDEGDAYHPARGDGSKGKVPAKEDKADGDDKKVDEEAERRKGENESGAKADSPN
jgi:hypothetical protein